MFLSVQSQSVLYIMDAHTTTAGFVSRVGTFGDPPNLTLTHLTRRLTLILFRLGLKELVMGGYCVQKQPRGSRLSLPG